jgi:hypothetical protein
VVWTFRALLLGCPVHREFMRSGLLDLTPYNTPNCLPPKK